MASTLSITTPKVLVIRPMAPLRSLATPPGAGTPQWARARFSLIPQVPATQALALTPILRKMTAKTKQPSALTQVVLALARLESQITQPLVRIHMGAAIGLPQSARTLLAALC